MSDTLGTIRVKDLPDTGSISGADVVLVDNADGTRKKTITELASALSGGVADVVKTFVRLASVNNIADLTTLVTGATLDGKTLALADRIFLPYQTTASERLIYVVANSGAPAVATDFDASGDVARGAVVFVTSGDVNAGTAFVLTTGPAAGITAPTWSHIRAHSAGSGVTMTPAGVIAADLSGSTPQPVGTAAAGASGKVSDAAHVHALPLSTLAALLATGTVAVTGDVYITSTGDVTTEGHTASIVSTVGDVGISAQGLVNFAAGTAVNMGGCNVINLPDPSGAQDAANKRFADQPTTRAISGTTGTLGAADIGAVLKLSNAGSITLTTANLSSSLRSGGSLFITIMLTGGGTLTIADGSGCTHSGSPSGTSCVLWSDNGTTWYVR